MATRIKPSLIDIDTREDAERHVGIAAGLQNQVNDLKVKMDNELLSVRKRYEGLVDTRSQELDRIVLSLESWANRNPQEFTAGRKSIEFVHGVIGFRTGTPKVKKGRKFPSFEAIADVMAALPWARKYVKHAAATVNKEALIADRGQLTAEQLNTLGLQIVQDETFFVEPKVETLEQGARVA
jgi:phage host-nuclease inhibitor protein Gam